jgi:hypothetical protein
MSLDLRLVRPVNPHVRGGAALAVALALGFVTWVVIRNDDDASSRSNAATTSAADGFVAAATAQRLRVFARAVGHPVFWAGPRRGVTYELTQTGEGRIYIRYLPRSVPIGERRRGFLLVATYPLPNAYDAVKSAAREDGGRALALKGGGLAVYNDAVPTNVYFAEPGSKYQVEVYHPNPRRARALVTSGRISPIR